MYAGPSAGGTSFTDTVGAPKDSGCVLKGHLPDRAGL